MYFKVKPDSYLTWTLIEQSTDETGMSVYTCAKANSVCQ